MSNEDKLQQVRIALLKYYSSESMKHGEFIIGLGILLLTIVSTNLFLPSFLRYAILSFFFAALVHTVGRTLYWGYLAHEVLNAEESNREGTPILRLHYGTDEKIDKRTDLLARIAHYFTHFRPLVIIGFFALAYLILVVFDPETNAMLLGLIRN